MSNDKEHLFKIIENYLKSHIHGHLTEVTRKRYNQVKNAINAIEKTKSKAIHEQRHLQEEYRDVFYRKGKEIFPNITKGINKLGWIMNDAQLYLNWKLPEEFDRPLPFDMSNQLNGIGDYLKIVQKTQEVVNNNKKIYPEFLKRFNDTIKMATELNQLTQSKKTQEDEHKLLDLFRIFKANVKDLHKEFNIFLDSFMMSEFPEAYKLKFYKDTNPEEKKILSKEKKAFFEAKLESLAKQKDDVFLMNSGHENSCYNYMIKAHTGEPISIENINLIANLVLYIEPVVLYGKTYDRKDQFLFGSKEFTLLKESKSILNDISNHIDQIVEFRHYAKPLDKRWDRFVNAVNKSNSVSDLNNYMNDHFASPGW